MKKSPFVSERKKEDSLPLDPKELHFPETSFIRDIESRVFQGIVMQVLEQVCGVYLQGSGIIDNLLGRERADRAKAISVEQDQKKHSVQITVDVSIEFGQNIPAKAEEIQNLIVEQVSQMTGLHVSCVHIVFKNVILPHKGEKKGEKQEIDLSLAEEKNNGF